MTQKAELEVHPIEKELREAIKGEVRFSEGDKHLYSTDSSNYKQIPIGVIIPKDKEDVVTAVKICKKYNLPITSRGAGTGLGGQTTNAAVIFDFSKYMNKILSLNEENKTITVQPGVTADDIQAAAKSKGLQWGPLPSTHYTCTVGGMIGNNACGTYSVLAALKGKGPRTSDNLESMEIVTYDGEVMRVGKTSETELEKFDYKDDKQSQIYSQLKNLRDSYADLIREKFPKIPRRVSGYNLDDLLPEKGFNVAKALAGSEGTCTLILEATLDLVPRPKQRVLLVIGFKDVYKAGDNILEVLEYKPNAIEGMDDVLIKKMQKKQLDIADFSLLPKGEGWLIADFGAETIEEARELAQNCMGGMLKKEDVLDAKLYDDLQQQNVVWEMRESGLGVTAHVPNEKDAWEGWEDSAVPPEKLGDYLREFRKLYEKFGYKGTFYGHFGQGLVHTRTTFDLKTTEGVKNFMAFMDEATDLIVKFGGVFSGEHGDGQSKAIYLEKIYGKELMKAFAEFKNIWDPANKMNPHKVINPYRPDENLRYGPHYNPPIVKTHFKYPADKHSFAYAMERCVGVGKCRKTEEGTMCPSYMATREEKHSTRGRARLLFEMLQEPFGKRKDIWKKDAVKDALNLCLACKACKSECPVNVDMAMYKAEFMSQYYKGRIKPLPAYTLGLIFMWAKVAEKIPRVANFFLQSKIFSYIPKKLGGIHPKRGMPVFAIETFEAWFNKRDIKNKNGEKVIFWPDTFNNYFYPETAKSAVRILESAGYQVTIPEKKICCGRPLYDFGMLDMAKSQLKSIMAHLKEDIENGVPIVGIEPSCISTFQDELINLYPNKENAKRLSQSVFHLSEFIMRNKKNFSFGSIDKKALIHFHCHQDATLKTEDYESVLQMTNIDYKILDSGCCGMAGSFGYEKEKYDVSVACGERVLIPEVKNTTKDTLIVTDGFSCKQQIQDLAKREVITLPELLEMAIKKDNQNLKMRPSAKKEDVKKEEKRKADN